MKRRTFLKTVGCGAAAPALPAVGAGLLAAAHNACVFAAPAQPGAVEARHYVRLDGGGVECRLCPRACRITDLERGYCGVRENRGDTYYTLVHGRACALNIDPVEKKPLYHFLPGSSAYSFAAAGCNVHCKCCQNWEISQARPEQVRSFDLPPAEIVRQCRQRSVPIIAATYTEPTVYFEYLQDTAILARKAGIRPVMVSGGYIMPQPLTELLEHLCAVKIDLKAIRQRYYTDYVDGELKPVLDALVQVKKSGVWLEIVYLVIPTLNDSDAEFRELARWIKANLGPDVPVHFSRFQPQYLLTKLPATPLAALERAYGIATAEGLRYVYLGNIPGHRAESTFCPKCGSRVVERHGYRVGTVALTRGECIACGTTIPGVWT